MNKLSAEEIQAIVDKHSENVINAEMRIFNDKVQAMDRSNFNALIPDMIVTLTTAIRAYTEQTLSSVLTEIMQHKD